MISKIILVTVASVSLMANTLVLKGENAMVKLQTPKITKSVYLGSFLAQGHLPANEIYRIDAPVEGVVEKLNVNIYESIKKRRLLAVIKSPKMLELESTYINLLIEKEYNENEVARLKPLYEAAVVAKKQYLKAQNTLAKYNTQTKFYYHLLQEWGLSKSQVERISKSKKPIPEIKIYAPIAGKIADLNIFPKMYLQRGEHMMTILNEKGAHLEVALPLSIAKRMKPGLKLYIQDMPVEVESIAAEIDTRTQTLSVHLIVNKPLFIMPNEKKNVKLFWPQKAFELPSSAVVEYNDKSAIFVKNKEGYKLLYVNVLGRNGDQVYVNAAGLSLNDKVAVTGAISLKGALEGQSDD